MTALAAQLVDGDLSRTDGIVLLVALLAVMALQIYLALKNNTEATDIDVKEVNVGKAFGTLILGLVLLIASSRAIVWGAVELATIWE